MTQKNKKINMGIRGRILLIFSGFSLISLVLISSIIGGFLSNANQTTAEESQNALTTQIQTNLITSASENAFTIGEKLRSAINDVKSMAFFAQNLFENPDEFGEYPSFIDIYNITFQEELDLKYVEGYGANLISFNYSMYHLAPGVAESSVENIINISANLDHIFKYTKQANPDFGWIYMGFEEGVFRCYPWAEYNPSYDPRLRPWYNFTAITTDDGIKITKPYVDANGLGLMITIAKEVRYTNGTLIGVIAADLTIDTLQETILDINILESGYAFMIDKDGIVIAHSNLEEPDEGDLEVQITQLEPIPSNVLNNITSKSNGYETFIKTVNSVDKVYYLAFSEIDNTDFIVVAVVPEEEALQPVDLLDVEIARASSTVTTSIIVVIIIATIISVGLGTIIAGQITKPVAQLTEAVKKLTKQDAISAIVHSENDVLIDSTLEAQDDEIGDLTRAFKGMLTSIKRDQSN